MLLARRKIGLICIIISSLLFYSGLAALSEKIRIGPRVEHQIFRDAQQAFQAKHYQGAIMRCRILIRERPEHLRAWQLLASSWLALKKEAEAKMVMEQAKTIKHEPDLETNDEP